MTPTLITTPGGERLVLVPEDEWRRLVAASAGRTSEVTDVIVPADVANRIFAGENPVRVYRHWRGLTARELARAADVSAGYLSDVESGRRRPSAAVREALAGVLGLTADDLVPAATGE